MTNPSCKTCLNWCDRCLCPMQNDAHLTRLFDALHVVSAAVRQDDKTYAVRRPARHHNVMAMMRNSFGLTIHNETQGFILSDGRFAPRDESLIVARSAGQVDKIIGGTLTSEDLW